MKKTLIFLSSLIILASCNNEVATDNKANTTTNTNAEPAIIKDPADSNAQKSRVIAAEDRPDFTVVDKAQLKSSYKGGVKDNVKITSKDEWNQYFESSDAVDFEKQYVIAVVLDKTDNPTEILPVSLIRLDGAIILNYEVAAAKVNKNFLVLTLDKSFEGNVKSFKVNTSK